MQEPPLIPLALKEKAMTESFEPRCITCKFAVFLAVICMVVGVYFYGAEVGREVAKQEMGRCK